MGIICESFTKLLSERQFIKINEFAEEEEEEERKGDTSVWPPFPRPPTCLPTTRVTKFALRFYTPRHPSSSPLPPPACPTMIQPLSIALQYYCPTFMALPHYSPVRLPPVVPPSCHAPADVTYHGRGRAGRVREGRVASPLWRKGRSCRCAGGAGNAPLPGFREGQAGRKGANRPRILGVRSLRSLASRDTYRRHAFSTKYRCINVSKGKGKGEQEGEREIRAENAQRCESKLNAQSNRQLNAQDHILTFRSESHLVINVTPSTSNSPTLGGPTEVTVLLSFSSIFELYHCKI